MSNLLTKIRLSEEHTAEYACQYTQRQVRLTTIVETTRQAAQRAILDHPTKRQICGRTATEIKKIAGHVSDFAAKTGNT